MLSELIDAVGYENIIKENIKNNKLGKGVYAKIPLDRELQDDDFLLVLDPKNISVENLEFSNWFKEVSYYSEYIGSNKAVPQKPFIKLVMTNQENAIMFNYNTFIEKTKDISLENVIYDLVDGFVSNFNYQNKDIFIKSLTAIYEKIKDFDEKTLSGMKIGMFLDVPISEYINGNNNYMSERLFNKEFKPININDILYGTGSVFININPKKPFLKSVSNSINENTYLSNSEELIKLVNLKKYIGLKNNQKIKTKIGHIEYESMLSNQKWEIKSYLNNPYNLNKNIFENKSIIIEDNFKKISEPKIINSKDSLRNIFFNITNGMVNGRDSKDKPSKFKHFEHLYYQYYNDLNEYNIDKFIINIDNIIKGLYKLFERDFEDINKNKIKNIVNLEIALSDYFKKTNIRKEIIKMKEYVTNKISKLKGDYIIESDDEFSFISGSLIKYYKNNTQGEQSNKLLSPYSNIKSIDKLLNMIKRDSNRLDYDNNINGRSNRIYTGICSYYHDNKDLKLDRIMFNIGLRSNENVLYTKSENIIEDNEGVN